ncbi:DNA polymerase V subunit UmuC domain protein [Mycobacterium kansasii 732]|nr:DNA polymerase V subunit UmuC domain protein [Mycobacterium kansasii 732]
MAAFAQHEPIESTFATVRLRQRVTKGPGFRAAVSRSRSNSSSPPCAAGGWSNASHLVALVRAGAEFTDGKFVERPDESAVRIKPRNAPIRRHWLLLWKMPNFSQRGAL